MPLIDNKLLEILVCPEDKSELEVLEQEQKLQCKKCKRRYPVKEGIPVMLVEEAESPDQ